MNQLLSIPIALRVPAPEVNALIEGQIIAIISKIFLNPGRQFSLCPGDSSLNPLPTEEYYDADFLDSAQTAFNRLGDETVLIKAWARCDRCEMVNDPNAISPLSKATIWTPKALQEIIDQGRSIFLAYLRVYHLENSIETTNKPKGNFVNISLQVSENWPVLPDEQFIQSCEALQQRKPRPKPQSEKSRIVSGETRENTPKVSEIPFPAPYDQLQPALTQLADTNPAATSLNYDLQRFLGLIKFTPVDFKISDLAWIKMINQLGDRSKEEDAGKSNYQAGTDFENIVRKSLEFLGFTIDYSHKGGAGGLDLACSAPYPLVGECKAGKNIPNNTAVQLLNLASLRLLDPSLIKKAVKLIIGPGKPTKQLLEASKVHGMSIIKPETLEKLVTLENQYPRCIDLFKLKKYLKPGEADQAIENYITEVKQQLKVRSQIIQSVKNMQEVTQSYHVDIGMIKGSYFSSNPPVSSLTDQQFYEILIELSSCLAGYLGRIPGNEGHNSDRFYFLRDLAIVE